jgi:hypothetical protein
MAAIDHHQEGARNTAVVTPSDSADLSNVTEALWIGGAGNVTIIDANGDTTLFSGIPAGTWLPVFAARVKSTNTTATSIVAIW